MKKVIVIGAGPAGYVAAIKSAQQGFETVCIERQYLGGTCLNVGCIPSKSLLHDSLIVNRYGFDMSFDKIVKNKNDVVNSNSSGIGYLFKKNGVKHIKGAARFEKDGLYVDNDRLAADYIIIASGSNPSSLPGIEIDEKLILSSTGALDLQSIPKKLIVVGAGYIGLELGSVYGRLGTEVTVLEYSKTILPSMEPEVAKVITNALERENVTIKTGVAVKDIQKLENSVIVIADQEYKSDYALISVGRHPNTRQLGLDNIGIKYDDHGFIEVDDYYKTTVRGIYAIGDCINGPMLAHRGYQDAKILIKYLDEGMMIDKSEIPGVMYTDPEVAHIGLNEKDAIEKYGNDNVLSRKSSFSANPRARIMHSADGFVKIVFAKKSKRLLGATIVGPEAGNMIHQFAVALAFGASTTDLALICHAHPTLNEIVVEVCDDKPVH